MSSLPESEEGSKQYSIEDNQLSGTKYHLRENFVPG